MTAHRTLIAAALSALSLGPAQAQDILRLGAQPSYHYDDAGRIVATACSERGGTSALGSGCVRDSILMQQVVNPADLVIPMPPGPPMAAPLTRAIDDYLRGPERPSSAPVQPAPRALTIAP